MENVIESTALISLEDQELELVAGGCGRRRHHGNDGHGRHGYGRGRDIDIDFNINIIVFAGNQISAGDDVEIDFDQENN